MLTMRTMAKGLKHLITEKKKKNQKTKIFIPVESHIFGHKTALL